MKHHTCNRRRIYSPEPGKSTVETMFARKYVNYLVPALLKISKNKISSESKSDSQVESEVRYHVDMALVMSTHGFSWRWSHALGDMLLRNTDMGCLQKFSFRQAPFSMKISLNPKQNPKFKKLKRAKRNTMQPRMKKETEKKIQEEKIGSRLKKLKSLLPGGHEMDVDELVSEVGSYIVCLELQVNVLKHLVAI